MQKQNTVGFAAQAILPDKDAGCGAEQFRRHRRAQFRVCAALDEIKEGQAVRDQQRAQQRKRRERDENLKTLLNQRDSAYRDDVACLIKDADVHRQAYFNGWVRAAMRAQPVCVQGGELATRVEKLELIDLTWDIEFTDLTCDEPAL